MYIKLFIGISLVISWILSFVFVSKGAIGATAIIMLVPGITAAILQFVKTKSIKEVFRPFVKKINVKSVVFTFAFPLSVIALCSILSLITGIGSFSGSLSEASGKILTFILLSIPFAVVTLGEEYGWRGFLLPQFAEKYNLKKANLIVGAVWMAFHFPAFLLINLRSGIGYGILFTIVQLLSVFFMNYGFTYLYSLSHNVILPAVMHAVWNNINSLVLGDAYRNTSKGLIIGNVNLINGERVFGMVFLAVYAVIIARRLYKNYQN